MNMKRLTWMKAIGLGAVMILAWACKKPEEQKPGQEVLAEIGDVKITVQEFQDTINSYTPYLRSKYNTPEMKKKKLEEMVRFELLAMEAKKKGYDKDPMVQRALRQSLIRELLQVEVEDKIKLEDISEEEMKKYYEEHPEKYNKPAQRRVAHILVKDKKLAEKVLAEALQDEMNAMKFRDLVIKYSDDPINKTHGGDLGYFSAPGQTTADEPPLDENILKTLYELEKVGQISKNLVETPEGFHIVKFTSTKPEVHRTYEQVKRQIQSILWKQKREEAKEKFIESLRAKAKIKINEKALSKIQIPEPPKPPGLGPGEGIGIMQPPKKPGGEEAAKPKPEGEPEPAKEKAEPPEKKGELGGAK